jgi:hypothetical protein
VIFKVKYPKCDKTYKVETDTGLAVNGEVYHDAVECECGEAFIMRTEISMSATVLAVAPPEDNKGFGKRQRIKKLLTQLENEMTKY